MTRILLGVTGSVAAIRAPELIAALAGPETLLQVVLTRTARYFVGEELVHEGVRFHRDEDEWPPGGYHRGDPVLHIELRKWADVLVVAPLDAHTLAKFALGLSDNLLSCAFRAWDFSRPVILAPAMNTLMWESPVTRRHLAQILHDRGDGRAGDQWSLEDVSEVFAAHAPSVVVVPPISKRLACGDFGTGAMAEVPSVARAVQCWLGDE